MASLDRAVMPDDLVREYVRLDKEINFHLRMTEVGEGVPSEYLRLCEEREAVVLRMYESVGEPDCADCSHPLSLHYGFGWRCSATVDTRPSGTGGDTLTRCKCQGFREPKEPSS